VALSKDWKNDPDTSTPLSATAMEDLETRINAEITSAGTNTPSSGQKSALAGTAGTPGSGNKYVTDADTRNSDNRDPTSHASSHGSAGSDPLTVTAAMVEAQQAWQTLAAPGSFGGNTWTGSVQYYKDSLGIVHLRGTVASSDGIWSPAGTFVTLPAGYCPGTIHNAIALMWQDASPSSKTYHSSIVIGTDGVVTLGTSGFSANPTSASFDGISFRAEN
jgi:hypothetical protein